MRSLLFLALIFCGGIWVADHYPTQVKQAKHQVSQLVQKILN
jgi:hypothetical protein